MRKTQEAEMTKLTIRLPKALIRRAKIRALQEERPLQDVVAELLEGYLKSKGASR
jgi:predicted DNA binding CopG/RHH family protein